MLRDNSCADLVGNFFLLSSFVGSEKKLLFDPRMKKEK
jgi:hypothetical protein